MYNIFRLTDKNCAFCYLSYSQRKPSVILDQFIRKAHSGIPSTSPIKEMRSFGTSNIDITIIEAVQTEKEADAYLEKIDKDYGTLITIEKPYKKRQLTDEHVSKIKSSARRKPVYCKETDQTYDSVKAAGESLGITCSSISAVLHGTQKTAKGHTFKFVTTKK
jgi:bisphosphoglycerate-dependent phosphoglycerate mutase